ncbi:head-specific guanylate cyclase-like, partial [Anoplophora glabripennis]|uniref:head-specific guanylate cyclase-like n=1 Tax=Anoplophora glabripennis TaxID=217634 RepID=UPI000873CBB4
MECPLRRVSVGLESEMTISKKIFGSRQNSFQVLNDEPEEGNETLNLKHLNQAILILTAPPNEALEVAVNSIMLKEEKRNSQKFWFLNQLPRNISNISHYAYLDDLFDILKTESDVNEIEFLDRLGQELIVTTCTGRLEAAFMCLGSNLKEFLTTLDGVHDVLKSKDINQEEDQQIETFVCTYTSEKYIQLDFTTDKISMSFLMVGILKAVAKILYSTDVDVAVTQSRKDGRSFRYIIQKIINEDCRSYCPEIISTPMTSKLEMSVPTFCKAFPWHFVLDRHLEFVQLGYGFMRLFGRILPIHGTSVATYFEFSRPRSITLTFNDIIKTSNTPFLLTLRNPFGHDLFAEASPHTSFKDCLQIKGQMIYCKETDSILFIGSPFIDGLNGLTGSGLFISDIPLHDATRDVILVGEQARAQDGLRRRMDKLKNSIEEGNKAVDKEREKNVSLLHLIFPPDIAKKLWLGESIEAKTHEDVTMLFSDIVGFTSICSTATPMMVINMLQNLYNQFDIFCGHIDVYK